MHGFGFGGEWAAGAVLMGEVIRDKYRGRGVGVVQTGWAVGWGASALVYTAQYALLPEAIRLAGAVRDRPDPGGVCLLDPPSHRRAQISPVTINETLTVVHRCGPRKAENRCAAPIGRRYRSLSR
jgi:hypothetical protein